MPHFDPAQHGLDHAATEAGDVLPWQVADTAPQNVVPDEPPTARLPETMMQPADIDFSEDRPRWQQGHRGRPKRGFRWGVFGLFLFAGLVIVAWLFIAYALGAKSVQGGPQPVRTVTETPEAVPGPRVTVQVPGPARVVTKTQTRTRTVTATRTVPGPTVTVTSPAPLTTGTQPGG